MLRKCLAMAMVCLLGIGLLSYARAESESDYVLSTNGPSTGGEPIEVILTNNSTESITVSGVELAVAVKPSAHWDRNVLDPSQGDVILGGQDEITIEPEGMAVIAEIASGTPDTWRPNNASDYTLELNAWVRIDGVYWNLEPIDHVIVPGVISDYDLTLGTNSPTEYDPHESIILKLINNSADPVTISGEVVVQGTDDWSNQPGQQRISLPLLGGETMEIGPGETADIAEIEPGTPMSWQNFYGPKIIPIQAWVEVEGSLWHSGEICHAIVGETSDESYFGWAKFKEDNGDGTATLTVRVDRGQMVSEVYVDETGCHSSYEDVVGEPATGLGKERFQVLRQKPSGGEEVIGHLVSVKERNTPGVYDLIWSYQDGAHAVFVQVLDPERPDYAAYMGSNYENYPEQLYSDPLFDAEISSKKPLTTVLNSDTGKYEATLEYPMVSLFFSSETDITGELSFQRKGTSVNPPPEGAKPAGIYFDINVDGELDCDITLEISYSLDDIPVGMNENNLVIFRFNEDQGQWEALPNQEVDTQKKVIRVYMQGFSQFGIFEITDLPDELAETGMNIYRTVIIGLLLMGAGLVLISRRQLN